MLLHWSDQNTPLNHGAQTKQQLHFILMWGREYLVTSLFMDVSTVINLSS